MKLFTFVLLVLLLNACSKEKVDENHYFISSFHFVSEKDGDKYPMELRCDFMIHLYRDSVQLYQNSKNEVFWSEKIKVNKEDVFKIKKILKEYVKETQIAEYPIDYIVCRGPAVRGPYFFGSISSSKKDLFNPIHLRENEKMKNLLKRIKISRKGKFSSIMYKEIFFQTTWMNLEGYEEPIEASKQIQFLPPIEY